MNFFSKFNKVYCISLKSRTDRRENFLSEVNKYNLGDFSFFDAIDGKEIDKESLISSFPENTFHWFNRHNTLGAVGLIYSNIQILEEAITNDYENILILEDDCFFSEEIKNIQSYLDLVPENCDILYFGGNHYGYHNNYKINEKILKLQTTHMTHAICIKKHMYEILKKKFETFESELDNMYLDIQRSYNVYSVFPSIIKQKAGHSDIVGGYANYEGMI